MRPSLRWLSVHSHTLPHRSQMPKGERPAVSRNFYEIGYAFDQEQQKRRSTNLNLTLLDEGRPELLGWCLIRMVPT